MEIHVTNMSNKSLEVVYVIKKVSKQRVSRIVSSVWWRAVQTKQNVVCCAVR